MDRRTMGMEESEQQNISGLEGGGGGVIWMNTAEKESEVKNERGDGIRSGSR